MKSLILVALAITLSSSPSFALNVSGSYKTTEGDMTLQQHDDRVSGAYTNDNGEITGIIYDSNLDGFWIENHSDRRCSTPKHGRYYWGRISLEFTPDGFSGTWGYCNDAPSRNWTGTRTSGYGSADSLAPNENNASIEGVWSSSEGDITFSQHGNKIKGRYNPQDNGELIGTIKGSTFDSVWIENHSAQRCSSAKNGRYFWGKLQLIFDGDSFSGMWGYCDERPSKPWTGKRK